MCRSICKKWALFVLHSHILIYVKFVYFLFAKKKYNNTKTGLKLKSLLRKLKIGRFPFLHPGLIEIESNYSMVRKRCPLQAISIPGVTASKSSEH